MTNIKLSLIIPCYNVESYINECLNSIKASVPFEYQHFIEIIIIDDGSTDNTSHAISQFNWCESQFDLIVERQSNQGLSATRNTGLNICRGKYISFLDSDDIWLPDMAEVLNLLFRQETDVDIIEFNAVRFNQSVQPTAKPIFNNNNSYSSVDSQKCKCNVFSESVWMVWARIFRRELIGDKRFAVQMTYEDIIFTSECYLAAKVIINFKDKIGVGYRYNPSSISAIVKEKDFVSMNTILEQVYDNYLQDSSLCRYYLLCNTYIFYQSIVFALEKKISLMKYEVEIRKRKDYFKLGFAKFIRIKFPTLFCGLKKIILRLRYAF